jgi:hypothetical protein
MRTGCCDYCWNNKIELNGYSYKDYRYAKIVKAKADDACMICNNVFAKTTKGRTLRILKVK